MHTLVKALQHRLAVEGMAKSHCQEKTTEGKLKRKLCCPAICSPVPDHAAALPSFPEGWQASVSKDTKTESSGEERHVAEQAAGSAVAEAPSTWVGSCKMVVCRFLHGKVEEATMAPG